MMNEIEFKDWFIELPEWMQEQFLHKPIINRTIMYSAQKGFNKTQCVEAVCIALFEYSSLVEKAYMELARQSPTRIIIK